MKRWWEDRRLACPPEVVAEFQAEEAFRIEHGYAAPFEFSKEARRMRARHIDLLASESARSRNKKPRFDREQAAERATERAFERALGLRR